MRIRLGFSPAARAALCHDIFPAGCPHIEIRAYRHLQPLRRFLLRKPCWISTGRWRGCKPRKERPRVPSVLGEDAYTAEIGECHPGDLSSLPRSIYCQCEQVLITKAPFSGAATLAAADRPRARTPPRQATG